MRNNHDCAQQCAQPDISSGGQKSRRQVATPSLRRCRNAISMNEAAAAARSVPVSADVRPLAPASSPHPHTWSNQPVLAPLRCLPQPESHSSSEMPFAREIIGHRRLPAQHPRRLSSRPSAGQAAYIHFPDYCFSGRLAEGFTPGGTCWPTCLKRGQGDGSRGREDHLCPLASKAPARPRCAGRGGAAGPSGR
jgi:hypothetical protein